MELVVARRGNNPRTRCRHGIPRMVRLGTKRLGDGRHHPLSLWNAVELHRFDCLSRPFSMVAMEGEAAQVGPRRHLLAHSRIVFAHHACGVARV